MSTILNSMGLESHTETFNEAEAQGVSTFSLLKSGAYKATVKELATFVTEKGAKQLKIVVNVTSEDHDITIYQNITKKDGEPNVIGTATFKHVLDALGEEGLSVVEAKIKGYAKEVDAQCIQGMSSKPIIVLVREVHQPGEKLEEVNEIDGYLEADGTNAKNENMVDAYVEKITKTPILERKVKAGSASTSAGGTTTAAAADIENLI